MAVALRGSAWVPAGNPTTSFTAAIDATVATGDILYMVCTSRDHTVATNLATLTDNDTGGNTWTPVLTSTDRKAYLFQKVATSGSAGKTVTFSGAVGSCSGVGKAFSGAATAGNPTTNALCETNASADETDAGFTPTVADSMLCCSIHNYDNDNGVTTLVSAQYGAMTTTEKLSTGGSDCATAFGHDLMSGSTATGNVTWAQTNGAGYSIHWGIRPPVNTTVTPDLLALPTATFEPTVTATLNQLVTPPTLALVTASFAPTVATPVLTTPSTVALTTATFEPSVVVDHRPTPTTLALSLTTFEPTVATPVLSTPTTLGLTTATFEPTVTVAALDVTATPDLLELVLTTFAPVIGLKVEVTPAALTVTTFAPTALLPVVATPSTLALTTELFAATVSTPVIVTPTALSLTLTTFVPIIVNAISVTPSTLQLTLTTYVPTVRNGSYRRCHMTSLLGV